MNKILVFAGSNRKQAFSGQLARAAVNELTHQGAEVTFISLADYPLPIMDEDLEKEHGIPENAMKLGRLFAEHRGLLISSPEYNASIPPLLKNTLDWLSRISEDNGQRLKPFADMTVGLCSSSTGSYAGLRGLYHLRAVLMMVGVQIISEQCCIAHAQDAFSEDGSLRDERNARALSRVCQGLVNRI